MTDTATTSKSAQSILRRFSQTAESTESAGSGLRDRSDAKSKIDALRQGLALIREQAQRSRSMATDSGRESAAPRGAAAPVPAPEAHERLVVAAESGLNRLVGEGDAASLTAEEEEGLEFVLVTDGSRPSLFVQDDDLDFALQWNSATVGDWQADLEARRPNIRAVLRSVGLIERISGGSRMAVGTGYMIAPGLILTNKHVLQGIGVRLDGRWTIPAGSPSEIDFAAELDRSRQSRFRITGVRFASPDVIGDLVLPPQQLDAAILEVDGNGPLPPPLPILNGVVALPDGATNYLVGYPVTPQSNLTSDQVAQVFGEAVFTKKRLSPGRIINGPTTFVDGNTPSRVFSHDCSTLRGNSGSCVVEMLEGGRHAIGLHFGGSMRQGANFAHALDRLRELLSNAGANFVTPGG